MSDNRNFSAEVGNSAAGQVHSSSQVEIPQEEMLPAAGTGLCLPKLVEDVIAKFENLPYPQNQSPFTAFSASSSSPDVMIEADEASVNKESNDSCEFGINRHLSQDNSEQTPDSSILSLKQGENATSKNGNRLSLQNRLSITQPNSELLPEYTASANAVFDKKSVHQLVPTKDKFVNDFPPSTSSSEKDSENKHSSNKETKYTPWTIENLFGRQSKITLDGSDECKRIERGTSADKSKEVLPSKDLAKSGEKWPVRKDPLLNNISIEYRKLYSELHPEKYDFAMNIMAYIEYLNDPSWEATVSYFDEKIKRIIKYIWNALKNDSKCDVLLHGYQRKLFLDLLVEFTEACLSGEYRLIEFLKYCVEMCKLGVIARNHNFKEAPLRVIGFLRSSIGRLELRNYISDTFEKIVKEYAEKLYTRKLFPLVNIQEKETENANNFEFNKAPGDPPKFAEAASSEFPSSNSKRNMTSESDNWFYNQNWLPLMTHSKSFPFFENSFNTAGLYNSKVFFEFGTAWGVNYNDISSYGQITDKLDASSPPLCEQIKDQGPVELLASGQSKALQMEDEGNLPSERKFLGSETKFLLNEREEKTNIGCGVRIDERVAEITNESLAPNEGINPKDISFTENQSTNDVSPEYIQLYSETHPNNQDFALNIMAYIELLNDSSWNATFSHFDENIKKIFNFIWQESKVLYSVYAVEFRSFHHMMYVDKMVEYTELCLSAEYDLVAFLYYCVQMCQIGVMARKNGLTGAPMLVINFLRNSINRLTSQNSLPDTFENIVKGFAQKFNEC